jgi:general secretion pathway protein K
MMRASIHKSSGVILPTVLWITILTIVIASNYASDVNINTNVAENIKSATLLKHDSISGFYVALKRLLSANQSGTSQYQLQINSSRVNIDIRPENQKTDLNSANDRELTDAFKNAGVISEVAQMLADRVIDWRDGDSSKLLFGMEDRDYESLGKDYGAKDSRIEDLVEILLIADLDPDLFSQLSYHFTVYGKGVGKLFTLTSTAVDESGDKAYMISALIQLTYQTDRPYRIIKWLNNQS